MKFFLLKIIINYLKKLKNYSIGKLMIILAHSILLKSRIFYEKYELIEDAEIKIFSQNGEDGIVDYIIQKLNLKKPSFVEIGVGDFSESNTRLLYEMYYGNGLIVDINQDLKKKVSQNVNLWKGNLNVIETKVSSKNINSLLKEYSPYSIDLFSIDIDGIDYWVINELNEKISKIFILEYNSIFGSELEVSVPDSDNFSRNEYHYSNLCYGASLKAYVKLMDRKGYYLLGVNRLRNNAFFINKDYPKSNFFPKIKEINIKESTNLNFTESRDQNNSLSYLDKNDSLRQILDCDIIDLSNAYNKKSKLRSVLKI
jgi:hypothetical protein